jgi:hypothetical protein
MSLHRPFPPFRRAIVPTADVGEVSVACDALRVAEIELFRLAFARWFGRPAEEREIEPPFMRYLKAGQSPLWVRHLARQVMTEARQGRLDRRRYGLPGGDVDGGTWPQAFDPFARIAMVIALAAVLAIVQFGAWR